MSDPSTTSTRARRLFATAVALLGVAALTLGPRAIVAPARGSFLRATKEVASPVLALLPFDDVDQLLNAMLFVPLGAALALLLPRRMWWLGIAAGFALSAAVEYLQASIPGRVPDADDVLWNTVGTAVGVLAVSVPRLLVAEVRRGRRGHRTIRGSRARR